MSTNSPTNQSESPTKNLKAPPTEDLHASTVIITEIMYSKDLPSKDLTRTRRSLSPQSNLSFAEVAQRRARSHSPPRHQKKQKEEQKVPGSSPSSPQHYSSSTDPRSREEITLKNTQHLWWSQVALGILQENCGEVSDEGMMAWQLDMEFWKIPGSNSDEFELEPAKIPKLNTKNRPKKTHISHEKPATNLNSADCASNPSDKDRTFKHRGKYHIGILSYEEWAEFRLCARVVENLQMPLVYKEAETEVYVLVLLKKDIDMGPIERKLYGKEIPDISDEENGSPSRLSRIENVDKVIQKLKTKIKSKSSKLKNSRRQEAEILRQEEGEHSNIMDEIPQGLGNEFTFGNHEQSDNSSHKRKRDDVIVQSRKVLKMTSEHSKFGYEEIHKINQTQSHLMQKSSELFEEMKKSFELQRSQLKKDSEFYRSQMQKDLEFQRKEMQKNLEFQRKEMQKNSEFQLQQMQQMQKKESKPFLSRLWDLFKN